MKGLNTQADSDIFTLKLHNILIETEKKKFTFDSGDKITPKRDVISLIFPSETKYGTTHLFF